MVTKFYDGKLKEAMRRIEAICQEYDCGAFVSLVSRAGGEFRYVLPKWQRVQFEKDETGKAIGVRLRQSKAEGHTHEDAEMTAHFIHSIRDTSASCFMMMDQFTKVTNEKWKTEHTPFSGYRPHRDEEN